MIKPNRFKIVSFIGSSSAVYNINPVTKYRIIDNECPNLSFLEKVWNLFYPRYIEYYLSTTFDITDAKEVYHIKHAEEVIVDRLWKNAHKLKSKMRFERYKKKFKKTVTTVPPFSKEI